MKDILGFGTDGKSAFESMSMDEKDAFVSLDDAVGHLEDAESSLKQSLEYLEDEDDATFETEYDLSIRFPNTDIFCGEIKLPRDGDMTVGKLIERHTAHYEESKLRVYLENKYSGFGGKVPLLMVSEEIGLDLSPKQLKVFGSMHLGFKVSDGNMKDVFLEPADVVELMILVRDA